MHDKRKLNRIFLIEALAYSVRCYASMTTLDDKEEYGGDST